MKIVAWSIQIVLESGKIITCSDLPDYVSQPIDEWLSELEEE
jgi:hypothetical protein|tara:strand:+ start:616 stop:741 length:126 start_codon:yes stop_codon:yes gene_type:complete